MQVAVYDALVAYLQSRKTLLNTFTLHLYQNNYTPLPTSEVDDFTECDFSGYAPIAISSWGDAYLNASNYAQIDEVVRTFTNSTGAVGNDVYGYFVTDGDDLLVFAEKRTGGPVSVAIAGATFSVQCRQTCRNDPGA